MAKTSRIYYIGINKTEQTVTQISIARKYTGKHNNGKPAARQYILKCDYGRRLHRMVTALKKMNISPRIHGQDNNLSISYRIPPTSSILYPVLSLSKDDIFNAFIELGEEPPEEEIDALTPEQMRTIAENIELDYLEDKEYTYSKVFDTLRIINHVKNQER